MNSGNIGRDSETLLVSQKTIDLKKNERRRYRHFFQFNSYFVDKQKQPFTIGDLPFFMFTFEFWLVMLFLYDFLLITARIEFLVGNI